MRLPHYRAYDCFTDHALRTASPLFLLGASVGSPVSPAVKWARLLICRPIVCFLAGLSIVLLPPNGLPVMGQRCVCLISGRS